ncbi:MAG: M20/M25/M40 family metallo-hydrolase [Candidatus Bathyarchaeia archaeon]
MGSHTDSRGEDRWIDLLMNMLKIYSPSGQEKPLASYLAEAMGNLGYEVSLDAVGNVRGKRGNGRPIIVLCSHMDTVPGPLPIRLEDDYLWGRGAVDAKASLAAMIAAGASIDPYEGRGTILTIGVVDEEGASLGVKHLVKERLQADYAIFGEPSGLGNITIGYKGRLQLKIRCSTVSGHAASPWAFENAIEGAYSIYMRLRGTLEALKASSIGNRYESISVCITGIRGGEAPNVVPGNCEATLDVRLPPSVRVGEALKVVDEVVEAFRRENPKVRVGMDLEESSEAFEVPEDSSLVQALSKAIYAILGTKPKLLRKTGTGDMNLFGMELGIPCVTYGPGESRLGHTPRECISLREFLTSIQVYRKTLENLFSSF